MQREHTLSQSNIQQHSTTEQSGRENLEEREGRGRGGGEGEGMVRNYLSILTALVKLTGEQAMREGSSVGVQLKHFLMSCMDSSWILALTSRDTLHNRAHHSHMDMHVHTHACVDIVTLDIVTWQGLARERSNTGDHSPSPPTPPPSTNTEFCYQQDLQNQTVGQQSSTH